MTIIVTKELFNGHYNDQEGRYGEASQAMLITGDKRLSRIANCIESARIIRGQIACIADNWGRVCEEARLTTIDRALLWHNQILNPDIAAGLEPGWL